MAQIHASCVAVDGLALLLRGPSGAGKSDLALRLVDEGARLVADDRVDLLSDGQGGLMARCPQAISGLMEVRGLGVLPVPSVDTAPVALIVDLETDDERLPQPGLEMLAGVALPRIRVNPFHASTPAKLRLAMAALSRGWPLVPGEGAWRRMVAIAAGGQA
ncbi:aldolase [Niveispirillum sp.]|uniref:HPr kinase/phosphorylase n=1 Tax=Niveispirillum sp. TaxID=1917217 RepID=UPI001B5F81F7|nr:aldolase [Niveispirillum sp.]MBP7335008.1 aldolase [Niveispirillum sp.]